MYFDGNNLEAETEEEENRLVESIRAIGDVRITKNVSCHTLKVSNYTFIVQQGGSGWINMAGFGDESGAKLYELYLACGGKPEEID